MNSSLKPEFTSISLSLSFAMNSAQRKKRRCRLSDPKDGEPHFLRRRLGPPLPSSGCYSCGKHDSYTKVSFHWYCVTCDVQFHDECHRWPREMKHPFHLQHSLSFSFLRLDGTLVSDGNFREFYDLDYSDTDSVQGNCDWCGNDFRVADHFYRCSLCGFSMCWICSMRDVRLTIENPKTHPHPLNFFPRPLAPCEACGLTNPKDPTYACLQCLCVIHESCLSLPRIIKITRHPQHRLSRVSYLSPAVDLSCRVCHRRIDPKYGAYTCTSGCSYALHSKCATREDIWDCKELDGEPEEPEEAMESFVEIGEKEIIYFSHPQHSLHLIHYKGGVRDAIKQCQACILPIDSGNFYNCKQCDFILHTECANLPRKMYHVLHRHPLFLDPLPERNYRNTFCSACGRVNTGFRYKCTEEVCYEEFRIDLRCALSISDSVVHNLHKHSLFIDSWRRDECRICDRSIYSFYVLRCFEDGCNFVMCLECGSLPPEVRYKYDNHPLTLCYEEGNRDTYWCEECEKKIDVEDNMLYTCDDCCTTFHVSCVYPPTIFMKVGCSFTLYKGFEVKVVWNMSSTRPFCSGCFDRCQDKVLYMSMERCFCSLICFGESIKGECKDTSFDRLIRSLRL